MAMPTDADWERGEREGGIERRGGGKQKGQKGEVDGYLSDMSPVSWNLGLVRYSE